MKRLNKVIYEVNGKDCFVKAKDNSFPIERTLFSFVKYDTTTMKALYSGDFYLDFGSCLQLISDVERGILQRDIANEIKRMNAENQKYPKPVRQYMGGNMKDTSKRSDGRALARMLTIEPGTKMPYILKYMEGEGKEDAEGKLIIPSWWSDKGKKPDFTILVPCSSEDMGKLIHMIKAHINGYIASCYMKGTYEMEYQGKADSTNQSKSQQQQQSTTSMVPQGNHVPQNNRGQKPHTVYTPSTTAAANQEGETSDERYTEATFKTAPSLIEGSAGLYTCHLDIKGKDLQLYFTSDKVKEYKEEIIKAAQTKKTVILSYVIVRDEEKNAYTYFMSLKSK